MESKGHGPETATSQEGQMINDTYFFRTQLVITPSNENTKETNDSMFTTFFGCCIISNFCVPNLLWASDLFLGSAPSAPKRGKERDSERSLDQHHANRMFQHVSCETLQFNSSYQWNQKPMNLQGQTWNTGFLKKTRGFEFLECSIHLLSLWLVNNMCLCIYHVVKE